jgi:hypothetical protein
MKANNTNPRYGKFSWGLAAMLLGLPLPLIILAFFMPGCR